MSLQDVRIGAQQVKLAEDHVRVTIQERAIAEMQAEHAEVGAEFLANKFTNAELFDWMADILERVYAFFLQQATAVAQLSAGQLAFERQEPPPPFIQADYREPPSENGLAGSVDANAPDRRGLTGSARLLQDIFQLDQHAFETDKRKLQLTKTISLAQLSPAEFERFRQTGVLTFATPMEVFDRDFPGHYLRLVKRIRTSVIALTPPTQGIRATLSVGGTSRVVIGGNAFQTVVVTREPESVALSAPLNATGLFELDAQPEMLAPFEGRGVDTAWELRLPKAANPFEFSTIADVLLTIEYTALDDANYRTQVIQTLGTDTSFDRPFSFRHQFPDQWYDLHNPEQTATPMQVRLETVRADFAPNLDALKARQILLFFSRPDGVSLGNLTADLRFVEQGRPEAEAAGGSASPAADGIISTLRGNAGGWAPIVSQPRSPFGTWTLTLPTSDQVKNLFKQEQLDDILFVITYSGRAPDWPA